MAPPRGRRRGSARATTRASTRASARAATRSRGRGAGSLAVARGGTRAGTTVTEPEGTEPQVVGVSQEEPAEVISLQATVDRLVEEALRNRPREPVADGHFPGMSQGVGGGGGGGGGVSMLSHCSTLSQAQ